MESSDAFNGAIMVVIVVVSLWRYIINRVYWSFYIFVGFGLFGTVSIQNLDLLDLADES